MSSSVHIKNPISSFESKVLKQATSSSKGGEAAKVFAQLEEQMQKTESDQLKMLTAESKHAPVKALLSDGEGDPTKAMTDMQDRIMQAKVKSLELNLAKTQYDNSLKSRLNLSELKGKNIAYVQNEKFFNGSDEVRYGYKLLASDAVAGAVVECELCIKDSKGKKVKTHKIKDAPLGNSVFVWDGRGDDGELVASGDYKLEAKAFALKYDPESFEQKRIDVTALVCGEGIVESLEIKDGAISGLMVNGVLVQPEDIQHVESNELSSAHLRYLQNDMIDKDVEIDLSKAYIKKGKLDCYCVNHLDSEVSVEARLYDATKNNLLATVPVKDLMQSGFNKITADTSKLGLDSGEYFVEIHTVPKDDSSTSEKLNRDQVKRVTVQAIDQADESIFALEEKTNISVRNIRSMIGHSISTVDQMKNDFMNSDSVTYKKAMNFDPQKTRYFDQEISAPKDQILASVNMCVVDPKTQNVLYQEPGLPPYTADDVEINNLLVVGLNSGLYIDKFERKLPDTMTQDEKDIAVRHFIYKNLVNGNFKLKDLNAQKIFDGDGGAVQFTFDLKRADDNKLLSSSNSYEVYFVVDKYHKNDTNTLIQQDKIYVTETGEVSYVEEAKGGLSIHLSDGSVVDRTQIMSINKGAT